MTLEGPEVQGVRFGVERPFGQNVPRALRSYPDLHPHNRLRLSGVAGQGVPQSIGLGSAQSGPIKSVFLVFPA